MYEEDEYYSIEMNIRGIRMIHRGLVLAVQNWSGGDPEEQEDLISMRDNFYRMVLEHQFQNMD
tara:strand:+ start:352 stop:540 length:189 start_codon:yes stop_codon:yes gene_type:complete